MNTGILPVYLVKRPSVSEKNASVAPKQIITKPTRWIPSEQVTNALRNKTNVIVLYTCKQVEQGWLNGEALASHQCGPGSIPGPGVICGLSLSWFSTLLRGVFSGYSSFPPSANNDTQFIQVGCWLWTVQRLPEPPLYAFGSTLSSCVLAVLPREIIINVIIIIIIIVVVVVIIIIIIIITIIIIIMMMMLYNVHRSYSTILYRQ